MDEPVARGAILLAGQRERASMATLAREAAATLRALRASADAAPAEADFVIVLVEEGADPAQVELPDLKDRAGAALGFAHGTDESGARAAVAVARRQLRAKGASLGARELVFRPEDFGHLGLESDGRRERLEVLLRALVLDAERLRLRREGWEEPDGRPSS